MSDFSCARKPKIAVLLSTYNGEKFLEAQLESIFNQKGVDLTLFARDDGSSDRTADLLREKERNRESMMVETGENIGVFHSFMYLLKKAGGDFDFYAFCDQDDYWKPEKLLRASGMLNQLQRTSPVKKPVMYYSRLEFSDRNLNPAGKSPIPVYRGFHNALVQNQATGCTVVLDSKARNLICSRLPDWALMHDWWCYLVISAFGLTIYDETPGLLYRKHENNVTPATPHFLKELYARTWRFMGHGDIAEKVTDQAREFFKCYGPDLPEKFQKMVLDFLEARNKRVSGRIRYALRMPLRRNTTLDTLILRILIIIGRF